MKTKRNKIIAAVAATLFIALLGGCNEYRIAVAVDENGGGTRELELVMKEVEGEQVTIDADRMPGIYMIGDEDAVERRTGEDGSDELVYRATRRMSGPADWKGVKMDIRIDGASTEKGARKVRFANDVSVETGRSTAGRRVTYRETFAWEGLLDVIAGEIADRYVRRLEERFPGLSGEEKAELRGAMNGVVTMGFKSMGEEDDEAEKLRRFAALVTEQSVAILGDRIKGSAKSHVFDIAHDVIIDPQEIVAGHIQRRMPGVLVAGNTGIRLEVTMPGRIVETNGEIVEGSTVRWEIQPLDWFSVPREAWATSEIAD